MDDLYGDLQVSTQTLAKTEALYEKTRLAHDNTELRHEIALLQRENRTLGERNQVLETNISSLFVTAQNELKRKDAEIQRLRDALDRQARPPAREASRDSRSSSHRDQREPSSRYGPR